MLSGVELPGRDATADSAEDYAAVVPAEWGAAARAQHRQLRSHGTKASAGTAGPLATQPAPPLISPLARSPCRKALRNIAFA